MSTYLHRLTLALLLLPIALFGGSACAPRLHSATTALTTLARYREALVRDDSKVAYELMAPAAQQSLPYAQFVQQWKQTQPERAAQAAELQKLLRGERSTDFSADVKASSRSPERDRASDSGPGLPGAPVVQARAVVTLPQGSQLVLAPASAAATERFLVGRPSVWRILDPDLQIIRAPTPEAALRLLVAAAEQRNYPALLRLLTRAERQSLEAELNERLDRLRSTLSRGLPTETTGTAAGPTGGPTSTTTGDRTRIQYDPRFFIDLRREQDGWRIADFN